MSRIINLWQWLKIFCETFINIKYIKLLYMDCPGAEPSCRREHSDDFTLPSRKNFCPISRSYVCNWQHLCHFEVHLMHLLHFFYSGQKPAWRHLPDITSVT